MFGPTASIDKKNRICAVSAIARKMPCLRKTLLSQAAVLAYFCVLVLVGFNVGKHHLLSYFVDSSIIRLRGRRIHGQNVSLVITEEVEEVRVVEVNRGENEDIKGHKLVSSVASMGGHYAPSMEDTDAAVHN